MSRRGWYRRQRGGVSDQGEDIVILTSPYGLSVTSKVVSTGGCLLGPALDILFALVQVRSLDPGALRAGYIGTQREM